MQLPYQRVGWLLLIVVGTVLATDIWFVGFDFVNWDDSMHVLDNPLIARPREVSLYEHVLTPSFGYPIPLTILTYRLNHLLVGFEPGGYHFNNVLLHILVVVFVFQIGRQLGLKPWAAAIGAVLFGLHPLTVEPVAWVTGRKDLLATLLALITFSLFLTSYVSRRSILLLLAGLCYFGSLLSKPSALGLGCLVIAVCCFRDETRRRGLVLGGTMIVAAGLLTTLVMRFASEVGAVSHSMTLVDRVENLSHAGHIYLQNIILPLALQAKYILGEEGVDAPFPFAKLLLVALAVVGLFCLAFHRKTRTSALGIGSLWFLATLAPASGIIPSPRFASDSYVYVALPGLCWVLGHVTQVAVAKHPRLKRTMLGLLMTGIVALIPIRVITAEKWQDGVCLWEATYAIYPDSPQVCRKLGNAHMFGRSYANSPNESSRRAVAVFEMCIETVGHRELFVGNLGVVYFHLQDMARSRDYLLEAISYEPSDTRALNYLQRIESGQW